MQIWIRPLQCLYLCTNGLKAVQTGLETSSSTELGLSDSALEVLLGETLGNGLELLSSGGNSGGGVGSGGGSVDTKETGVRVAKVEGLQDRALSQAGRDLAEDAGRSGELNLLLATESKAQDLEGSKVSRVDGSTLEGQGVLASRGRDVVARLTTKVLGRSTRHLVAGGQIEEGLGKLLDLVEGQAGTDEGDVAGLEKLSSVLADSVVVGVGGGEEGVAEAGAERGTVSSLEHGDFRVGKGAGRLGGGLLGDVDELVGLVLLAGDGVTEDLSELCTTSD